LTQSSSSFSRAILLRVAAFTILLLGLALALHIDAASHVPPASTDRDILAAAPLSPTDSKHYGYQMGQFSGSIGVLFSRDVNSLGQGRPLAILIALASFAAAGTLLFLADKSSS
jgi:hypothetical protein